MWICTLNIKRERERERERERVPFFRRRCPNLLQNVIHEEITLPHAPVLSIPSCSFTPLCRIDLIFCRFIYLCGFLTKFVKQNCHYVEYLRMHVPLYTWTFQILNVLHKMLMLNLSKFINDIWLRCIGKFKIEYLERIWFVFRELIHHRKTNQPAK